MKFSKTHVSLCSLIISIALLFTLSSCLPDNNNADSGSQVRVFLNLENINNVVTAGGDSLEISTLKFIHGNSFFLSSSDTVLFKENPEIIVHQSGQDSIKILADGVIREGSLDKVVFVIEQPPPSVQNIDPDFMAGDTLYSMVIEGTYKDSAFTFKSTRNFISSFELAPPLEAESNSLFQLILATDVSSWFLSEDGQAIINPADSAAINNNIEGSFRLEDIK